MLPLCRDRKFPVAASGKVLCLQARGLITPELIDPQLRPRPIWQARRIAERPGASASGLSCVCGDGGVAICHSLQAIAI